MADIPVKPDQLGALKKFAARARKNAKDAQSLLAEIDKLAKKMGKKKRRSQ
jgi:hypothetical protein